MFLRNRICYGDVGISDSSSRIGVLKIERVPHRLPDFTKDENRHRGNTIMATLAGGQSTALPLEFQSLWIAQLFIEVLRGRAIWVRIEPGDKVAPKSECVVCRPDGTFEAHQCKRQRQSKGTWSVADLESEELITAAK